MGLLDKKKSLLNDEQSHWGGVANQLVDDGFNYGGSALRGLLKGTVGLPVGLHNLVSDVTGRGSQIDTLSPEWVGKKVEPYLPDGNTKTEIAGEFINPFGAIKAASIPLMGLMFAGKNAKTADLFKLRKAEEMLKKGGSDRDAYAETGWTHGFADKKPRFEIDDSNVGFNPESYKKFRRMREGSEMPLSTAFPHPELSKAYPSGEKYSGYDDASLIRGKSYEGGGSASAGGFDYVNLNLGYEGPKADLPGMRSTALHENQHLVQGREGFGAGSDPTDMRLVPAMPKAVKNKIAELDKKLDELKNGSSYDDGSEAVLEYGSPERGKVVKEYYALKNRYTGQGTYKRSSGEAEARLTQARMNMTAAERAKSYPPDMFDVPVEDQIVSFGGGKQMSQKPTLKSIESANKNVQADVSEKGNILTLSKISVPKELRKKGHADAYMNDLVKLADEEGKAIALTPSDSFGANKNKLSRWYKTHGFVPNKGRNKDFSTRESMIRPIKKVGGLLGK